MTAADSGVSNPPVRRLGDWDGSQLRALAEAHDTPLYVLDRGRVRENYARLEAAFPDAEILYAAKANALGYVLETLLEAGAGIECASAGELARALEAGATGEQVHYTAVNPPAADLDVAVEAAAENPDLTITVGANDTIDRLVERGYDGRLCLRVNPGIGAGHHEKVRTGADAKFGLPADRAVETLVDAAERGFDVVGIHAHVGSGVSGDDLEDHRAFVSRIGDLAREVAGAVGGLEFVDVGGGFGVPYREDDPALDLEAVAAATREALGEVPGSAAGETETEGDSTLRNGRNARLTIEPGRYLVADAGVLLTRVNTVKDAPETTVVGVDAGMTTLARPAMYGSFHAIRNLTVDANGRPTREQTVTGPICESSDVFCTDRALPETVRGDLLAIGNAGAYGYEMASTYNSRPRPASVVLEADGDARLSRRRETIEDVVRLERHVLDSELQADESPQEVSR
ncbi:diaminopimelate decarboxylase [Natronosalvus vescus]|uniref:diaminopimelate decarboxylase n=1 Tax=Natronosalvus vescus TaxID=2953881 RepID=UPI0020917115|nr:diaminopimelate decarboxylase [Natronosalvus vescus]